MPKQGGRWLTSAVKKAFSCASKEKRREEKKHRKPRRWFHKHKCAELEHSSEAEVPHVIKEEAKLIEAENEQNRHAYSVALATAMAAEAAVAAARAAAEIVRLRANNNNNSNINNKSRTKEEIASVKIQTAFRGYLARRVLRALRGLTRLKSSIGNQSHVERQASSTLKWMHTLAHVQSEIRARRATMLEQQTSATLQQKIQEKHAKEVTKSNLSIGDDWDATVQSKEQIEANLVKWQEASVKRERALAYAHAHQQQTWRNTSSNPSNQTSLMNRKISNPRWGWNWLEQWIASRSWETNQISLSNKQPQNTTDSKLDYKTQSPDAIQKQSPSNPKYSKQTIKFSPRSAKSIDDESKSVNSIRSERYFRRHSIAGTSTVRDDESFEDSSCTTVPGYMASTKSTRAKSRVSSPLLHEKSRATTPDSKVSPPGSARKRLSYSGSPAGNNKRHSISGKIDTGPVENISSKRA